MQIPGPYLDPPHRPSEGDPGICTCQCSSGRGETDQLEIGEGPPQEGGGPRPGRRRPAGSRLSARHCLSGAGGMLPFLFQTGSQKHPSQPAREGASSSPAAGETMTANRSAPGPSGEGWPPRSQRLAHLQRGDRVQGRGWLVAREPDSPVGAIPGVNHQAKARQANALLNPHPHGRGMSHLA